MRRQITIALLGILAAMSSHANAAPIERHELTKTDADAWLDGFMPIALSRGDIAGAVVVIVKDGEVLTAKGYGYADFKTRRRVDPERTLFRTGSISKLSTWTAVMQLVEQGKIDLDADLNRYLDFEIPPFEGKPMTMRNIMTHTSGFDEAIKGGIFYNAPVPPLGDVVKRMLPKRVYAPGTTSAYSNYATALAGYVVERVSGMSFDTYLERHIFEPLGMAYSTFRQPLPANLAPFMAQGYPRASVDAMPFERVVAPPAGSQSASGVDMGKFMIAHLHRGAGLMKPETARLMHDPAHVVIPGLNRMGLGFYEQRINDAEVIGHGGDLGFFHSYLWLFPESDVGLFVSMNSAGVDEAPIIIREALLEQFGDRYFPPANDTPPVELPTAREHARMLAGNYISSRSSLTNFLDSANFLQQYRIELDADGRPLVPDLFGGPPRKWIEIAPFQWQDAFGHGRVGAKLENGKVVSWSTNEVSPFMTFEPAPWSRNAAWLMPLFLASLGIVSITALSWPIGAISRRRYGFTFALAGDDRSAYRVVRAFCWLVLATFAGWLLLFSLLSDLQGGLDWLIWLLEIAGLVAFFGLLACALRDVVLSWKNKRTRFAKTWSALLGVAAFFILWVALAFHLISFGTKY